jgi:meiotic recombination protein DMC1
MKMTNGFGSLWRVQNRENAAGAHSLRKSPITNGFGRSKWQSRHVYLLCYTGRNGGQLTVHLAFIDTEGTFRPERIKCIAEACGVDPSIALENILVARAYNSEHQMDLITEIATRFSEERGAYKLLVDITC